MSDVAPLRQGIRHGSGLKRLGGTWGECLAEFLGTFVLLLIGDGSVAMTVAGLPGSGRTKDATTIFLGASDWLLIGWGWAFAVAFGVYIAGGISGAHINPAVTLAFAVRRKFAWRKVVPYWAAQVVGAFAGAALVYATYHQAIDAFNHASGVARDGPGGFTTFSIFATFPAPYFHGGWFGPFLDQVVGTGILVMLIAALLDNRNKAPAGNLGPLLIGLVVGAIGMTFGANAGYAINPARDFGPRVFAWIAGWGHVALPGTAHGSGVDYNWYFWIPIIGPLVGGVIGVLVYDLFIGDIIEARVRLSEQAAPGPVSETTPTADGDTTPAATEATDGGMDPRDTRDRPSDRPDNGPSDAEGGTS